MTSTPIETMAETVAETPTPSDAVKAPRGQIAIRVPHQLREAANARAAELGVSLSDKIREWLEEFAAEPLGDREPDAGVTTVADAWGDRWHRARVGGRWQRDGDDELRLTWKDLQALRGPLRRSPAQSPE